MEKKQEDQKEADAQNGVKSMLAARKTADIESCGMLCAIMRPLRDSGMLPGTDRYVELEQRNSEVKRALRDA